jgi:hypothetical protein
MQELWLGFEELRYLKYRLNSNSRHTVIFPTGSTFTASATPHHAKATTPESAAGSPIPPRRYPQPDERRDGITPVQSEQIRFN